MRLHLLMHITESFHIRTMFVTVCSSSLVYLLDFVQCGKQKSTQNTCQNEEIQAGLRVESRGCSLQ